MSLTVRPSMQPQPRRPAARPPVAAGGGMGVDQGGNLQIQKDVLGFIPVQVGVDIADVLAGKYGRDFRLDFTDAGHARLTGDIQYGFINTSLDEPVEMSGGKYLDTLGMHVNDDQTLQLQGQMHLFGWQIPFTMNATPTKVGPGVFQFAVNDFQFGSSWHVPAAIAAWTTSMLLSVLGGIPGISAVNTSQVQVDFRKAVGAPTTGPAIQIPSFDTPNTGFSYANPPPPGQNLAYDHWINMGSEGS